MKKLVRIILSAVCAVFISTVSIQATVTAPTRTSDTTWVEDYADVLSDETEKHIQQYSQQLADKYSACIEVVTVDYVSGTIEDYALAIFNQWQLGSSDNNNGVLLLLSIGDDDYRMIEGRGLEEDFGVDTMKELLWDYLEDDFAAKDYDSGVYKVYDATYNYLVENVFASSDSGSGSSTTTPFIPATDDGSSSGSNTNTSTGFSGYHIISSLFGLLFFAIAIAVIIAIIRVFHGGGRRGGSTYYYTRPHRTVWYNGRPRSERSVFDFDNHDRNNDTHRSSGFGGYSSSSHSSGGFSSHSSGGFSSHSSGGFSSHSSGGGSSHGGSSRGAGAGRH